MGLEPTAGAADKDEYIALWNHGAYFDDWLNAKLDAINCSRAIIVLDLCHAAASPGTCAVTATGHHGRLHGRAGGVRQARLSRGRLRHQPLRRFHRTLGIDADLDDNGKVSVAEAFNHAAEVSIPIQTRPMTTMVMAYLTTATSPTGRWWRTTGGSATPISERKGLSP